VIAWFCLECFSEVDPAANGSTRFVRLTSPKEARTTKRA
jgi:hypothetical protein